MSQNESSTDTPTIVQQWLVNFPESKMDQWRQSLVQYARSHGALFLIADTETTGTSPVDSESGLFHRILEWSMLFCYRDESGFFQPCLDGRGDLICVDEPINPFLSQGDLNSKRRRSVSSVKNSFVHGITMEYLFGESAGETARPKLKGAAPTFAMVMQTLLALLSFDEFQQGKCPVTLVFHNAPFDIRFLTHECELWGLSPVESYFGVMDTLELAKRIIPKSVVGKYDLDNIYGFGRREFPELIEATERPTHTALIDSLILRQVLNVIYAYHLRHENVTAPVTTEDAEFDIPAILDQD